ncbi:MAG: hypothetical protein IH984_00640 [Planctomycetes bacterium]|nr:hypothetical protein [Planctomycetota bacterium]
MITANTVLILGAGASKPYGFPTGRELLDIICREMGEETGASVIMLQKTGRVGLDHIGRFREHLFKSSKQSVDAFVERQPDFLEIGKLAIAQALLPLERHVKLIDICRRTDSWYQFLYNKMDYGFDEFGENTLSILTFNYDRSLEEYLFTALKYSYNRDDKATKKVLRRIPIVHLYGQLSIHPAMSDDPSVIREYGANPSSFVKAAEGIKIISELDPDDDEFKRARELLSKADRVCFLGFGYDERNVKRLKVAAEGNRKVFGTTYKLGDGQILDAKKLLVGGKHKNLTLGSSKHDCYQFLTNVSVL